MKCKELGKILFKFDITSSEIKKGDLLEQEYILEFDDYKFKAIEEKLKKEELDTPNFYEISKEEWSSDQYISGKQTYKLNYILWKFLLVSEKSKTDLETLDKVINMVNKITNVSLNHNKLESKIENSELVLNYLKEQGFDTYFKFEEYFNTQYGINIDEYEQTNRNNFKINNGSIYQLNRSQKIIIDLIVKSKKTVFDSNGIVNNNLLIQEIKNRTYFPVYIQNYGYPLLNILKPYQISFEFSALDKKEDIEQQITKILELEYELEEQYSANKMEQDNKKSHNRKVYSSEKWQLLRQFSSIEEEENLNGFGTIDMLQKSIAIYQYRMYCKGWKEARLVYNFHVFLSQEKEEKDDSIIARSKDFITFNGRLDIAKNINSIKKILNLDSN